METKEMGLISAIFPHLPSEPTKKEGRLLPFFFHKGQLHV
jgi:hypothetical protein